LLDPHITNNLQDHFWRLSTTACYIFAATLHTWRPSATSATWEHASLWWEGPTYYGLGFHSSEN